MSDVKISSRAYTKMIFHAAKYPHLAVNGLLLGTSKGSGSGYDIVDAVPLFHQCLYVSPMSEIALIQVETKAASENLSIVGYYAAAENYYDNTIDKAPGIKIAEKIVENNNAACLVILDNKSICLEMKYPALKVYHSSENKWAKSKFSLIDSDNTLNVVSHLLRRGAMKELNDFDNYLDNTENDWENTHLNRDLKQIMSMY